MTDIVYMFYIIPALADDALPTIGGCASADLRSSIGASTTRVKL